MPSTGPVNIIAVRSVVKTSKLLSQLFNWKSSHGGDEFDILLSDQNIPSLLLHDFNAHEHERFKGLNRKLGVGQSIYVFVDDIKTVYAKVKIKKLEVVEVLFLNENSGANEFTFKLNEGYQFSVCDKNEWLFYNLNN